MQQEHMHIAGVYCPWLGGGWLSLFACSLLYIVPVHAPKGTLQLLEICHAACTMPAMLAPHGASACTPHCSCPRSACGMQRLSTRRIRKRVCMFIWSSPPYRGARHACTLCSYQPSGQCAGLTSWLMHVANGVRQRLSKSASVTAVWLPVRTTAHTSSVAAGTCMQQCAAHLGA